LRDVDGDGEHIVEPLGDTTLSCVISGRLAPGKGQLEAVEAIARLRRDGLPVGLWIVGDGDVNYRAKLTEMIASHRLEACVRLVGYKTNPLAYLRAADVVLVCSRAEAFGRATVEGMLAGKPVVATASGGTPELIRAGQTGLLYPPGDITTLGGHVKSLANDTTLQHSMGQAARVYAEAAFSPVRYADELLDVFARAVGQARTPADVSLPASEHPAAGVR
jgi:glycosyltransferase involved in cell wall biosynthesis